MGISDSLQGGEPQVHQGVLGTGLNPSLGILHEDKDGRPSFVYDLLEPLRPIVDRIVLSLVLNRVLTMNEDFFLLKDGTGRVGITPAQELARTTAEMLRVPSLRIAQMVRKILLAASERTYRGPRSSSPARGDIRSERIGVRREQNREFRTRSER